MARRSETGPLRRVVATQHGAARLASGKRRAMAGENPKLSIFISYSRDDLLFTDQLRAALQGFGFGVTIDRNDIAGGDAWKKRVSDLIRDADTVVFVLSPSSARSKICLWEVEEAVRFNKRIVPVVCHALDGVDPPPQLVDLQYVLFYAEPNYPGSGFGDGLSRLASALNANPSTEAPRKLVSCRLSWPLQDSRRRVRRGGENG